MHYIIKYSKNDIVYTLFKIKASFAHRHEEIDPIYSGIAYIKPDFVEKKKDIQFFSIL